MMDFIVSNYILFVLIILTIILFKNHTQIGNKSFSTFKYITFFIIALVISDIFEGYFASLSNVSIFRYIFSIISYTLRPIIILCFILITSKYSLKDKLILFIPSIINGVIQCTSFFSPLVFSFTDNNSFIRGELGYTSHVVCITYVILLINHIFKKYRNIHKDEIYYLISVILFCFIAYFLEAFNYNNSKNIYLLDTTMLMSVIFYYIFVYIYYTKRDPLTSLFNRQMFYEDSLLYEKKITGVISIDMNGLKSINDVSGHLAGDNALIEVAKIFISFENNNYHFYRIGGDEFATLCFNQTKNEIKNTIILLKSKLDQIGYSCSIGYAYRDNNELIVDLYKKADDKMYKYKLDYYTNKKNKKTKSN